MSNHLVKAYKDGNGSSGTSLHSTRSCWMTRWTNQGSNGVIRSTRNWENTQTNTPFDPGCVPSSATRVPATHEEDEDSKKPFSNNDFISLKQGIRKREKYTAIFSPFLSDNNFEGMEIDCQVDDARLYSKTTIQHHVLFSRNESTQHGNRGVKIQPLWSTTDSEKDNVNDPETPRCTERSFDLSAETDTMDLFPLPNENNFSGVQFSPIAKRTMETDKTFPMAGVDPWEDKMKSKLTVTETPSTSRTQSMETEHLLCCSEQLSESRTFPHESDWNRSVKRLKVSSSPSLDKTHVFQSTHVPVMTNEESSSLRAKKNPIFESSWIQRWCQDGSVEKERDHGKSMVVGLDEVDKKRLPSIAAVAMMGKSVDGLHACTYTKRGPLVVWNSKEY